MQIISCLLVMVGIILATLADAKGRGQTFECCNFAFQSFGLSTFWNSLLSGSLFQNSSSWLVGIFILIAALLLSALLGHMQEYGYRQYGKVWQENLFYSHALALPVFLQFQKEIVHHSTSVFTHPGVIIHGWTIPLSALLLINMISQDVCIRGVFMLTSVSDTLTTTLTITLRKFISLIFSVLYFNNPFTGLHWVGSALVFFGAALYSLYPGNNKNNSSKDSGGGGSKEKNLKSNGSHTPRVRPRVTPKS